MKKILWILGGFLFAFLVAVASVPLFVDVDQYRPVIVAEANKRINGRLELGKLRLGLWGAIKIHAESIKLGVNGFPEPMLDTKQFYLEIPFSSLFAGAPHLIAVLDSPRISVVRDGAGKTNALELLKAEGSAPSSDSAPGGAAMGAPGASEGAKVPAIVAGARLGLKIQNGDLTYRDLAAKSDYRVMGMDLDARNLGLGSPMEISLKAPLKGSSPSLVFEGPLTAEAKITPVLAAGGVKSVTGKVQLDASGLKVETKSGSFRKPGAMPLTLSASFEGSEKETFLRGLDLQFGGLKAHGKGRVTSEPLAAKLEVGTDPGSIRLDKVASFAPAAAPYQLKGAADLNLDIDWKPEALRISGDVKVADGGFFLKDVLRAPVQFRLQAGFSESSLNVTRAALAGPETDLELVGTVKNFLAPQFSFSLTGKSLNLDKLIVLEKSERSVSAFSLVPRAEAAAPAADVNPLLGLAASPVLARAGGLLTAKIGRILAYGSSLEQVSARAELRGLALRILDAGFRTFGGAVKATGGLELKTPSLAYHTAGTVSGISAREALKTYFPKYQNTLDGTVDASWNVAGAAFPAASRLRSLKGNMRVAARDGAIKSVDVQESVNSAMAKIPFLKNQKPIKIDDGFKSLTAEVRLDGGTIRVDPMEIQPRGPGVVVKGKSTILESLEQDTFLDIYDPHGRLPRELSAGPGKPAIPLHITGPLSSPRTDYEYTLKRVAVSAGRNVLKDQALKALGVEGKPGQSDQDKLKEAADKLRKKFGF